MDIGFSSCAASNYLVLMAEYFRCIPWFLRRSRSVQKFSGSSEVNPELRIFQREVSIEVKNEARALEVIRLFPEVWNRGSRFKGGQDEIE